MAHREILPGTDLLRAVLPDAPLSAFTLAREVHFRVAYDGAEVLLRIATESRQPPIELVIGFQGVVNFSVKELGVLSRK